jgi:putative acyl-CoA dehydrogenase
MSTAETKVPLATHDVTNQSVPLEDYNLYKADTALREAMHREGAAWAEGKVTEFGGHCGSKRYIEAGRLANANPPVLHTHDRYGHRIDTVEYHPAYHDIQTLYVMYRAHSWPWVEKRSGAHVARAALAYMIPQTEAGVGCPITMTFAVVPALKHTPSIAEAWLPKLVSNEYDQRHIPVTEKRSAQMGMAMTEKQGGSDVRANTTRARALGKGGPGGEYELTGHKWFCSAPMSDAFLTLAQTEAGLSCFFVPRFRPDGTKNNFFIQRLKDKLGNRSNASSEIEYRETWAQMLGEDGRGVPTIIDMVTHTRLDCGLASAGFMRQGVAQAMHHARHRSAFGKLLRQQPLMKNVLADLAVEWEAATMLMFRLARGYDEAMNDPLAQDFVRIATAVAKYWVCKRGPHHVYEAMECLGGAGYVEESPLPRLYRESPLTSIWEGSGNVMCLDVLRAMNREPETAPAFLGELEQARGGDKRVDAAIDRLKAMLSDSGNLELRARRLVEQMALTLQGALLVRYGNPAVAEAFCASRLAGDHGDEYGTLPPHVDFETILNRAAPVEA